MVDDSNARNDDEREGNGETEKSELEVQTFFQEFGPRDLVYLAQALSQYASCRGDVYRRKKWGRYKWYNECTKLNIELIFGGPKHLTDWHNFTSDSRTFISKNEKINLLTFS